MPRKSYKPEEIVAKLRQVDPTSPVTSPQMPFARIPQLATSPDCQTARKRDAHANRY